MREPPWQDGHEFLTRVVTNRRALLRSIAAAAGGCAGWDLATSCAHFFGIGVDPAVKVYTAESYPTSMRATGTSVTEGVGRLFSGSSVRR